jgi:hypothetical protein
MRKSIGTRMVIVLGSVSALVLAVSALAYFTGSGTGTGTATVGSVASAVTVTGSTSGELFPGGTAATVKITVKNAGSQAAHVETVSLTSITVDAGHSSCDTSITGAKPAFTMAPVSIAKTLAAGEESAATGSLQMNDTGVSQNSCQGASLTLHFASN